MKPFELFDPTAYDPLDPQVMMGVIDPQRLLSAAAAFPGGAAALVFALFWAPVGPGIPAGVLLARHAGLNPLVTFGLYMLSDVLGACVCHPLFTLLRRTAGRVPALHWLGTKLMRFTMIGVRQPRADDLRNGRRGALPILFRIGTVGFGVDVYTAGMLAVGLPVRRIPGWLAAIAGDLVWFSILLATSIATAAVTGDDRVTAAVMVVVMIAVPPLARRLIPALRPAQTVPAPQTVPPEPPATSPGAGTGASRSAAQAARRGR
jgi:hypothetical protein